jgi:hypothetical protein
MLALPDLRMASTPSNRSKLGKLSGLAASDGGGQGEHKAKNIVCFLFAMVVVWASLFSTGAPCGIFRAVF